MFKNQKSEPTSAALDRRSGRAIDGGEQAVAGSGLGIAGGGLGVSTGTQLPTANGPALPAAGLARLAPPLPPPLPPQLPAEPPTIP